MTQSIKYITGDATQPIGEGNKLIIHVCNNIGAWGAGFVIALSKRWTQPEHMYRQWAKSYAPNTLPLGDVQFVQVEKNIVVGNMIGQVSVGHMNGVPPIRYNAIEKALKEVAEFTKPRNYSVHAPKFGAGLAGGDWNQIEQIINEQLCQKGVPVTIYEFVPKM